jgi:hypothetical protein
METTIYSSGHAISIPDKWGAARYQRESPNGVAMYELDDEAVIIIGDFDQMPQSGDLKTIGEVLEYKDTSMEEDGLETKNGPHRFKGRYVEIESNYTRKDPPEEFKAILKIWGGHDNVTLDDTPVFICEATWKKGCRKAGIVRKIINSIWHVEK